MLLTAASVENTDVVAMDVLQDGTVVLFYDAREPAAQDTAQSTGTTTTPDTTQQN